MTSFVLAPLLSYNAGENTGAEYTWLEVHVVQDKGSTLDTVLYMYMYIVHVQDNVILSENHQKPAHWVTFIVNI